MFLQLESKLNLHFKVNVPFLLVLIYLLCLNPEASRTLFFFIYKISVRRFDFIFFWGKQFGFRTVAGFWFNRCICQYPRNSFFLTFLTSFYFFFFVYRLLKPPYRLKGLLDRIDYNITAKLDSESPRYFQVDHMLRRTWSLLKVNWLAVVTWILTIVIF